MSELDVLLWRDLRFMQRLTGNTEDARALIREFGLECFDWKGEYKGNDAAAEELTKIPVERRGDAFDVIFGDLAEMAWRLVRAAEGAE